MNKTRPTSLNSIRVQPALKLVRTYRTSTVPTTFFKKQEDDTTLRPSGDRTWSNARLCSEGRTTMGTNKCHCSTSEGKKLPHSHAGRHVRSDVRFVSQINCKMTAKNLTRVCWKFPKWAGTGNHEVFFHSNFWNRVILFKSFLCIKNAVAFEREILVGRFF